MTEEEFFDELDAYNLNEQRKKEKEFFDELDALDAEKARINEENIKREEKGSTIKYPYMSEEGDPYLTVAGKGFGKGVLGLHKIYDLAVEGGEYLGNKISDWLGAPPPMPGYTSLPKFLMNKKNEILDPVEEKYFTPRADTELKRHLANMSEMVGAYLAGGGTFGAGRAALATVAGKGFANAVKIPGSLKATKGVIKEAFKHPATVGLMSSELQEQGVSPFFADTLVSVPDALYGLGKISLRELAGLSPRHLEANKGRNLKTLEAAERLGLDVPISAVTDSYLTKLLSHSAEHNPFFARKQEGFRRGIEDYLTRMQENLGPDLNKKQMSALYDDVRALRLTKKVIDPEYTRKAAQEALPYLTEKYGSGKMPAKTALKTLLKDFNKPVSPKHLTNRKSGLNAAIDWDYPMKPHETNVAQEALEQARKGVVRDIFNYGQTNPEFYQKYRKADKAYGNASKRKQLQDMLNSTMNSASGERSAFKLSKLLNEKKTQAKVKQIVSIQDKDLVDDLATIIQAQYRDRPLNPSGTASTLLNMSPESWSLRSLLLGSIPSIIGKGINSKKLKKHALRKVQNDISFLEDFIGNKRYLLPEYINDYDYDY